MIVTFGARSCASCLPLVLLALAAQFVVAGGAMNVDLGIAGQSSTSRLSTLMVLESIWAVFFVGGVFAVAAGFGKRCGNRRGHVSAAAAPARRARNGFLHQAGRGRRRDDAGFCTAAGDLRAVGRHARHARQSVFLVDDDVGLATVVRDDAVIFRGLCQRVIVGPLVREPVFAVGRERALAQIVELDIGMTWRWQFSASDCRCG